MRVRAVERAAASCVPIERVSAFARFYFDEFRNEFEGLIHRKSPNGIPLSFDPEPGAALPDGGNAVIGDGLLHRDKLGSACTKLIPPFESCT